MNLAKPSNLLKNRKSRINKIRFEQVLKDGIFWIGFQSFSV